MSNVYSLMRITSKYGGKYNKVENGCGWQNSKKAYVCSSNYPACIHVVAVVQGISARPVCDTHRIYEPDIVAR